MPPSRRSLPALLAVSALLFACGASSAHTMDADPPGTAVESGPDGVGVRAPGALVEIDPGSYVLVCANGARVKVGVGEAPPCGSSPEPPPAPPPPEEPPPMDPNNVTFLQAGLIGRGTFLNRVDNNPLRLSNT